ncbi:MAG TPA: class I SAM-dependent methyltransferase [Acidimicrobiales bacterium]|nr:class I SAM-dependent methyltransferase [Acidimicrobiales bacterium]
MTTGSFEDFAGDYERHAEAGAYNALYDRPAVLDLMGDVTGLRLLDAGCGPGFYASELVARGAAQVVGFDASPEMVRLAGRRVPSGATFRAHRLGDPLDWIDDASVDGGLLALVIHHVDDRVAALRHIHRTLRPGGFLIVSTHHRPRTGFALAAATSPSRSSTRSGREIGGSTTGASPCRPRVTSSSKPAS